MNFSALLRNSPPRHSWWMDKRPPTDCSRCTGFAVEHKITLPFILKPDVGQRGNGVKLIRSMRAAFEYFATGRGSGRTSTLRRRSV